MRDETTVALEEVVEGVEGVVAPEEMVEAVFSFVSPPACDVDRCNRIRLP